MGNAPCCASSAVNDSAPCPNAEAILDNDPLVKLKIGDVVLGFSGGEWRDGKIGNVNNDGSFRIFWSEDDYTTYADLSAVHLQLQGHLHQTGSSQEDMLRRAFHAVDGDRSGTVSRLELEHFLKFLNISSGTVEQVMLCMDANCDGVIDVTEWMSYLPDDLKKEVFRKTNRHGALEGFVMLRPLVRVFHQFDADNSGMVSWVEMANALERLGLDPDEREEALTLARKMDVDGNGEIDIEEWKQGLPDELRTLIESRLNARGVVEGFIVDEPNEGKPANVVRPPSVSSVEIFAPFVASSGILKATQIANALERLGLDVDAREDVLESIRDLTGGDGDVDARHWRSVFPADVLQRLSARLADEGLLTNRMVVNVPEAGQRRLGVQVCKGYALKNYHAILVVAAGSVLDFEGDAIVNAANSACITGSGVDGAITAAGGPVLAEARHALPCVKGVRCPTGQARITVGGGLRNPYCIHAVGPNYWAEMRQHGKLLKECDGLVRSAYHDSMRRGQENALKSIGFSLLSAGVFRGEQTLKKVLTAGVLGILDGLYPELIEVHMVGFTREEILELQNVCEEILGAWN